MTTPSAGRRSPDLTRKIEPGSQRLHGDEALVAVLHEARLAGHQAVQQRERPHGSLLGAALDDFAGEHQGHDGAGGIEVDAVVAAKGLHRAVPVGHQDPHGEQRFHAQHAGARAGPRDAQNGRRAVEDAGRGQRHQQEGNVAAEAGGDRLEVAGVHHQAERHHVHGEEGGDADAQQQVLALGVGGLAVAGVLGGAVAERRHAFHDALARHVLRAVAHLQQVAGEHDFGGGDAARCR